MRVISLNAGTGVAAEMEAAVCIVGAGAAGLYLAHQLGAARVPAVVLEAGPENAVDSSAAGFDCQFVGPPYRGATEGRAFGLGGTTSRWGGQLVPFAPCDAVRDAENLQVIWRHVLSTCERRAPAVARALGVELEVDTPPRLPTRLDAAFRAGGLQPGRSCWLPFRKRNFTWLTRDGGDHATIVCDAAAATWTLDATNDAAAIRSLLARSRSGKTLTIRARQFVIAAGTIESTRILQEINAAGSDRVLPDRAALGHYLSDHLSCAVGSFAPQARPRVARVFAPRFASRSMRTWRFVETRPEPSTPRGFAHVIFPTENPGFQLARAVLQGLQARRMPRIGLRGLAQGSVGALQLAWHRCLHARLHVAPNSPCHLQLDMEQRPQHANSIRLGSERDGFGRPIAVIDWQLRSQDHADLEQARARWLARWPGSETGLAIQPLESGDATLSKPHDAYHPVGTCRIGEDAAAVAGLDLKVHGTANLYVLSTAIFPSAGSANPTFSLLCHAEQLVQILAREGT